MTKTYIKWCTGLFVSLCLLNLALYGVGKYYDKETSQLKGQYSTLKADLKKKSAETPVSEQTLTQKTSSAREAGESVAKLQSDYRIATGDSVSQISEQMVSYSSSEMPDSELNAWRGFWFKNNKGLEYHWEFKSTYDFTAKDLGVVWLCYDKDGKVLAYATAHYSEDTGKFNDFEMSWTANGHDAYDWGDSMSQTTPE